MEFQERGACHFHIIVDKPIDESELKRIWYEIVNSGDSRHLKHGAHISPIRKPEAFKKYLSAYLTKQEQKRIPGFYKDAGRFWGYTRSLISVDIRIIVGTKEDIRIFRRNFRIFRRWQQARYRRWNKGPINKKKLLKVNPYVFVLPGEYIYIRDARILIEKCKGSSYPNELFRDW